MMMRLTLAFLCLIIGGVSLFYSTLVYMDVWRNPEQALWREALGVLWCILAVLLWPKTDKKDYP